MCLAAQARGWTVYSVTQDGLYFAEGQVLALATPLTVNLSADPFWHLGETVTRPLASFSGVLMRKDPPFDMEYIYITYLLERAETQGSRCSIVPLAFETATKFFATAFPKFTPPLIVSKRAEQLRAFAEAEGDVVMKPLDGMGGASIFRLKPGDSNLSVVIETLTAGGSQQIMAQRYLPEIKDGDKRILMIEGKPVPYALARIPAAESRGNLAAGGRGEARPLTDRDREIAEAVGPELVRRGLKLRGHGHRS